jgi:integrase
MTALVVAAETPNTSDAVDSALHRGAPAAIVPPASSVRFPARPVAAGWPATEADRDGVLALAGSAPCTPIDARRRRGLSLLLDWLAEQPGESWQQRWLASGADAAGDGWADGPARWLDRHCGCSKFHLELMTSSLLALVGADVVRPSVFWLLTGGKKRKLVRNMIRARDREGFARLALACERGPGVSPLAQMHTVFRCAVIIAAKGGMLADVTVGDVLEVLDAEIVLRGQRRSGATTVRMLREIGVFDPNVPTLREILSTGQRPVEELVDRYPITCRPVRDLIVDYLKERQPVIDYSSLRNQSYVLARCFWQDLEAHHPGIDTLRLPAETARAWKQRLRTKTVVRRTEAGEHVSVTAERLSYPDVLACVRAFYLDLSQWALDDPARWAAWAAPCPIRSEELSRRKTVRRRKARMDARTRERLPALPVLVRTVERWRAESAALLAAARQARPGEQFTAAEQTLLRSRRPHAKGTSVWAEDPRTGVRRALHLEEDRAFWAWAVVGVLRLTGVRVEELLELSHYSLVEYRLPSTGELVPLLQIAPSKTDAERLIVVSPELADILSAIICRLREPTGAVPLVRARDYHEHVWLPPAPLLFQHRLGADNHAVSIGLIGSLLDEALARTGLTDPADGAPLHCTPHDFRRMFITDAILGGLPPHIAQIVAGHRDINVTIGYHAVYPEQAIQAHLAFLARRRSLRPTEEYRTPTDEEWQAFLGHFERRKVSVGTCGRAFGTPCIHEHACIRCSMLWPEPAQRDRLVAIRDNLSARVAEAQREGWLGEVEGLQISQAGANHQIAEIDRRAARPTDLGMPALPSAGTTT